eukprot:4238473-Ditylum_brightwellii.AAC.1
MVPRFTRKMLQMTGKIDPQIKHHLARIILMPIQLVLGVSALYRTGIEAIGVDGSLIHTGVVHAFNFFVLTRSSGMEKTDAMQTS